MSLKAKLTRLERQVEWLQTEGMYRRCKAALKLLEMKEQFAAHLARNPDNEVVRRLAWAMGLPLPPLPQKQVRPPARTDPLPESLPPALVANASSPSEAPEQGAAGTVRVPTLDEALLRNASQGEVRGLALPGVTLPPAPAVAAPLKPPPAPPCLPLETHDIPEYMQVRPIIWRVRGPQDEDDWDTGGHDPYRCLTDYDPLEEAEF